MAGVSASNCPVSQTSANVGLELLAIAVEEGRGLGCRDSSSPSSRTSHRPASAHARQARSGSLEEGHHLAFVVGGATGDDDLAMLRILGEARREGRGGPLPRGIRRLHVVMAVEQRRAASRSRANGRRPSACRASSRPGPESRSRVGCSRTIPRRRRRLGDRPDRWRRWDGKQLEQPIERSLPPGGEVIEHAQSSACDARAHSRPGPVSVCFRYETRVSAAARRRPDRNGVDLAFGCGEGLFAELHVDGLRALPRRSGSVSKIRADPRRRGSPSAAGRDVQEHVLAAIVRRESIKPFAND